MRVSFVRLHGTVGLLLAAAALAGGCGSNTALPYGPPKWHPVDAGVDADVDGGDAGPDAAMKINCIDVPVDGGPVNASLQTQAEIGRADVAFLIDVTASMTDEMNAIRDRLRDVIAPAIRTAIPDSQIGVATHADFPVAPYGTAGTDYVFRLDMPETTDLTQVQAALDAMTLRDGSDEPEAQVQALYMMATGDGLVPYVPPSPGCPTGGVGYMCFRRDALPVILEFTDAHMHGGPTGGMYPYDPLRLGVTPYTASQAMDALNAIGARLMGFDSGDGVARPDLTAFALGTHAVDSSGQPLVYEIGTNAEHLGTQVVTAIQTLASSYVQNVDAIYRDGNASDGIDATMFVEAIKPLSASPMSGVGSITDTAFMNVLAGTNLTFQITIRPGSVVPGPTAKLVALEITFRGNMKTRIGSELVYLLIPGADGKTCADFNGATTGP